MGMLSTVINSICLQQMLEQKEVPTRVMSAIEMREVSEPYIKRRADRHLENIERLEPEARRGDGQDVEDGREDI